jgi:hypothetical protein
MILKMLPKTRSGKCLRNVLKGMVRGTAYKVPPTISDASILPDIQAVVDANGLGKKSNLVFDENVKEEKIMEIEDGKNAYDAAFDASMDPEGRLQFWGDMAKNIEWTTFPKTILDDSNPPFYRWFKDGMVNICHNCVDRHLEKLGDHTALVYDSTICNVKKKFTFK